MRRACSVESRGHGRRHVSSRAHRRPDHDPLHTFRRSQRALAKGRADRPQPPGSL